MKYAVILTIVFSFLSCSKKVITSTEQPYKNTPIMTYEPEPVKREEPPPEPEPYVVKEVIIYFEYNSFKIPDSELYKINKIDRPARLTGGTCPIGSDEFNYTLGLKRAFAVRDALEERGKTVLSCTSVGENQLESESDYEINRRCEIRY